MSVQDDTRRSARDRRPTGKMLELLEQEAAQMEKAFHSMYGEWKLQIRKVRTELKNECSEQAMGDMAEAVKRRESELKELYDSIRLQKAPSQEVRRRIDACSSVTSTLVNLLEIRISNDEEYDSTVELHRLSTLFQCNYARSIYGSTVSRATAPSHHPSDTSETPSFSAGKARLAAWEAKLAAKESKLDEHDKPRCSAPRTSAPSHHPSETSETPSFSAGKARLAAWEAELLARKAKLAARIAKFKERVEQQCSASRTSVPSHHPSDTSETPSFSAGKARLMALETELSAENTRLATMEAELDKQQCSSPSLSDRKAELDARENERDIAAKEAVVDTRRRELRELEAEIDKAKSRVRPVRGSSSPAPPTRDLEAKSTEATLTQLLRESISLNRLPAPEPTVFTGDPLDFTWWSSAFRSLIDSRCSHPADKLFYLQRYVGGQARKVLEGSFFRKDDEAYQQAWDKLNTRYGDPFVIQHAFRDRLHQWPKIGAKEYDKLRDFSDYLVTCRDAIPHIEGLDILHDSKENQKLLTKLPDWVTSRWNRHTTKQLGQTRKYPSFNDFAAFVAEEAHIACNPITSLQALKPLDGKANALATSVRASETPSTTTSSRDPTTCTYCGEGHPTHKCTKLTESSMEERRRFVMDNKLCFTCLRRGHFAAACRNRATCDICKRSHPTPLHGDRSPKNRSSPQRPQLTTSNASSLSCCVSGGESESTSMIVPVWISSPAFPNFETLVYALLDTQSSHTFADQEVCERLQVEMKPVKLKLSTMVGKNSIVDSQKVKGLRIRGFSSDTVIHLPPAYTRDLIPLERAHIPTSKTANRWKHLTAIAQEMPPLMDCGAGLLIGYDCSRALAPRKFITGGDHEPYAMKTDLGWSIVGTSPQHADPESVTGLCHRLSVRELPSLTPAAAIKALESDFTDTKPGNKNISQEDIQFLQVLKGNIRQNERGHLEMPLPFKARPHLPDNKKLALVRLKHLRKKLDKDPRFKQDYMKFMEGIFKDGDAEVAYGQAEPGNVWYIPHQGVYHHKKPEKIRVVFDASARYGGTALNDHLLIGPDLTNGLTGVLCRFRKNPIAIMCDVEKMFHRFHVSRLDRDYLRFLWWENGDTNSEPIEYRMKVHLFGASSSPGCANYGLKHLAKQNEKEHPSAANFISQHFYVDDGLVSLKSVDEAIKLVKEAQAVCAKGKLHLHKFISNNREVLESIHATERATEVKDVDLHHDDLPVQRALGVRWNIENDTFSFKVSLDEKPATRRGILSTVASVYDPLGFVAPFILLGKRVLQEMCRKGTSWDEPLPSELKPRWESWMNDLENLGKVQIPRCFTPRNFGEVLRTELHHFSDASSQGYGQCSYIRLVSKEKVHCALIMSKARVAPTKLVTIPRLELTAAAISAMVSNVVKEELGLKVDKEHFWTDSRVVLGYINNEARRFHVFVANRVQRIRENTDPEQWYHVDSTDNPADHASRGLKVMDLVNSNWFTGPKFLWERELVVDRTTSELLVGDPEVKTIQSLKTLPTEQDDSLERLSRVSRWTTAVNVVTRIQRLARRTDKTKPLGVEERRTATLALIRLAQRDAFKEESVLLQRGADKLPGNHPLHQLDPFLHDGVMRVRGRLRKASVPLDLKHPIILPRDGLVTRLILAHHHEKTQHQGRGQTLNELRANGYWIVGGSKAVAQYIGKCVNCRRARRPPEEQRMADLPSERIDPSPPFTYCGMDCFGPFYTKQGRKEHKRYGLIVTCLCCRAVHIEMLEDMTTDALINALRCFIAIRGTVRHIQSDQGSNFIGAKHELERALKEVNEDRVAAYLADRQCDFRMNAPSSSHVGGVWERQIRTVRNVLGSVLALSAGRLDDASLRTLFYEAMSIVNNRPLAMDSISDPKSMEPLTPNHLLTMKSSVPLPPPGNFVKEDLYARRRWRRVQYLCEQFWGRWRKEYLSNITLRRQWHVPRRNVQVGDIVIIKEEEIPRNEWRLAKVLKVRLDDDGLVRRATVQIGVQSSRHGRERTSKPSTVERPIQKLVVLVESRQ